MPINGSEPEESRATLGPKLPFPLGRFTLCHELGAGGMATVYLTRMRLAAGLERTVALKTIHAHLAKEQTFVDMFLDEAKIASQISHPNVCAVFDFGDVDGIYYLAMEYLFGVPLIDIVNAIVDQHSEDPSPELLQAVPFLAARILADACEGLHAAHTLRGADGKPLNVVHRDVSPQNLFVTFEGAVKVVDFGCAKALERVTQTNTGVVKGKVSYAAPEQLRADTMDARTDVFALGICLWEMLTLRQLFRRDTALKTAMAVLEEPIPRAGDEAPWVPDELSDIAAKALAREPGERFETAREMGKALRRFIARSGVPFEAAEVAEWMRHLFPERREQTLDLVAKVEAMQVSRIAPVEVEPVAVSEERPVAADSGSRQTERTPSSGGRALERSSEAPPAPAQSGRALALIAVAVILLVAGSIGYVVFHGDDVAPATPVASAEPPPEAPPPPEPAPVVAPPPPDTAPLEEAQARRVIAHEAAHERVRSEPATAPTEGGTRTTAATAAAVQTATATSRTPTPTTTPTSSRTEAATPTPATASPALPRQGTTIDFSRGPVLVRTNGGWATIVHDNQELGRTPLRITLPVGTQRLTLLPYGERPGRTVDVDVRWGELRSVSIDVEEPAPN